MTIRRCTCGATPAPSTSVHAVLAVVQLVCKCGAKSARVLCHNQQQVAWARQAVIDGWNLGH
jgi:hypothetical protein